MGCKQYTVRRRLVGRDGEGEECAVHLICAGSRGCMVAFFDVGDISTTLLYALMLYRA